MPTGRCRRNRLKARHGDWFRVDRELAVTAMKRLRDWRREADVRFRWPTPSRPWTSSDAGLTNGAGVLLQTLRAQDPIALLPERMNAA